MKTRRNVALSLLIVALAVSHGSGQGETSESWRVVWEDQVILGGATPGEGTSLSVMTSARAKVFAAGSGPYTSRPSTDANILVRAYNSRNGNLLWASTWNIRGNDAARGIATLDHRVVVLGNSDGGPFTSGALVVRSYSADTGEVLWQAPCGASRGGSGYLRPTIAAHAGRVFVGGSRLCAYDARSGAVLWEDAAVDRVAVAAKGSRLFAAGIDGFEGDWKGDLFIRGYDAITGDVLWEVRPSGTEMNLTYGAGKLRIAAGGGAILVAWGAERLHGIGAVDAETGALLWRDDFATSSPFGFSESRVFMSGWNKSGAHVIRAYEVLSGQILWEQERPGVGGDIEVSGGNVWFANGGSFSAYDTVDGQLLESVWAGADIATLEIYGGRVFLGGSIFRSGTPWPYFGVTGWLIRAFKDDGDDDGREGKDGGDDDRDEELKD